MYYMYINIILINSRVIITFDFDGLINSLLTILYYRKKRKEICDRFAKYHIYW